MKVSNELGISCCKTNMLKKFQKATIKKLVRAILKATKYFQNF